LLNPGYPLLAATASPNGSLSSKWRQPTGTGCGVPALLSQAAREVNGAMPRAAPPRSI